MKKTIYILAATTMLLLGSSKLQAQCNYGNFSTRFTLGGFSKNYLLGTKITVTTGGVLQSLSFDSRTAGTGQVQMALYENVGGLPGNLVAQSGITNIVAGDMNLSVGAGINIAAGDYWIMAVYNVDGDKTGSYNNFGDNSLVVRYTSFEIGNAIPTNASGFVSYSGQTFNYWVVTNCGSSCTCTLYTFDASDETTG